MRNWHRFTCILLLALFLSIPLGQAFAQDMDIMDPATFGLDASKPYDGTELKFLICCSAAPQFASAAVKGDAEFTAMTGISVSWGDLPFGSFQEQLYLESTNPNTEFDVVAFVDALGHQHLRLPASAERLRDGRPALIGTTIHRLTKAPQPAIVIPSTVFLSAVIP